MTRAQKAEYVKSQVRNSGTDFFSHPAGMLFGGIVLGGITAGTSVALGVPAVVSDVIALFKIAQKVEKQSNDVFIVTPDGVVLPKGAKIPDNFIQNPYFNNSSYGIMQNGKYIETVRIDQATPAGFKGPNQSHFHLNNKGHIFDPNKWPW